ncbi:general substrate transporter [Chytriomyces cf. hyalinus JEL632]|nr:general substrate transporter [Chytriomyces cf. hyalinus JEL632]
MLRLCVASAALTAFSFGFHLGEVNQPREAMSNCTAVDDLILSAGTDCIPMDDWAWGTFVSIFVLGGTVGAFCGGPLAEMLGRRRLLFLNNAPYILAALLLGSSTSVWGLYAGRFIAGLSAGLGSVGVPLYIAEVAPVKIRGSLGAIHQLSIVVGILCSQSLGIPLSTRTGWRYLFYTGALPPLLQCFLLPFCVESPKWMSANGLLIDARKALVKLRSGAGFSDADIEDELESIANNPHDSGNDQNAANDTDTAPQDTGRHSVSGNADESAPLTSHVVRTVGIHNLFSVPALRKPLVAAFGLQLAQQLSGVNAAVFYSTTIFNQSYPPSVSIKLSLLVSVVNLITTLVSMVLIERLGRRTLLLTSELGMMSCGISIFIAVKATLAPAVVVVSLMGFVGFFGIGLGAIPWLILPELVPGYAVNAAASVCSGLNWGSSWIVALLLPVFIGILGYDIFLLFSVFLAGFAVFTVHYVPETKGLSPEEVARINLF